MALEELKKRQDLKESIDLIISNTRITEEKPNVITPDFIIDFFDNKRETVIKRPKKRVIAQEYESEISVKDERDITNKSFSQGNIEGFVKYFNNRYERLSNILQDRNTLKDSVSIEMVKGGRTQNVKIIGIVNDIRKSKKGHVILDLEDPTGVISVLVSNSEFELLRVSRSIVKDEVIGIEGKMWNDLVIANEIHFPDLPISRETKRSEVPVAVAMVSDIHAGSTKFLEKEFLQFIRWIGGELGTKKQRQLSGKVKYMIIGGDLVDGVGIYPGQENELVIRDIREQYKKISEFLRLIPEHIEVIIMPGNHDATRQAEPQPAILEEFAPLFYEDARVHMVGNPCHVNLHGVNILSYHGRSLDDIISTIPDTSYSEPIGAMLEVLKKRHLAPIYGGKVPITPEGFDYMLIEEVPDIVHFGHVHTVGVDNYRGTTLVNSGTFQTQTSFQRKLNMRPDPARVPIMDLQEKSTTLMKFIK
jgi:DNA polymerase II small subunit